uniref:Uncharacterized protein n=1 Tax=Chromera velia CCMP2878 TaxID=1169474 RepID=A0A0G4I2C5_9ALVE|eukprot:Cvel_10356.t1-p1 / transcript=Cvel_10356.t1 / gene=Cvel_10356 / organism=Chromera_velia_CCMP2878 / gene_product=hypothetical protein / transcript_product=hypothetical protein / location=Cvel_scaffold622:51602-56220(+) / protein_length=598 / sequence_SO=supercontig / SO=protein_coding / is_pseudo=false
MSAGLRPGSASQKGAAAAFYAVRQGQGEQPKDKRSPEKHHHPEISAQVISCSSAPTPLHDHLTNFDFYAFRQEYNRGAHPNVRDVYGRTALDYAVFLLEDLIESSLCTSFAVDSLSTQPEVIPPSIRQRCAGRMFALSAGKPLFKSMDERLTVMVRSIRSLVSIIQMLVVDRRVQKAASAPVRIFGTLAPPYFFMGLMKSLFDEFHPKANDPVATEGGEGSGAYVAITRGRPTFLGGAESSPQTQTLTMSATSQPSGKRIEKKGSNVSILSGMRSRSPSPSNPSRKSLGPRDPPLVSIRPESDIASQFDLADLRRLVVEVLDQGLKFSKQLEFLSHLPQLMVEAIECFGFLKFRPSPEVAQRLMQLAFVFDSPKLFQMSSRRAEVFSPGDLCNWDELLFYLGVQTNESTAGISKESLDPLGRGLWISGSSAPLPASSALSPILQFAPHIQMANKCRPRNPAFSFYQYTTHVKRQPYFVPTNTAPHTSPSDPSGLFFSPEGRLVPMPVKASAGADGRDRYVTELVERREGRVAVVGGSSSSQQPSQGQGAGSGGHVVDLVEVETDPYAYRTEGRPQSTRVVGKGKFITKRKGENRSVRA